MPNNSYSSVSTSLVQEDLIDALYHVRMARAVIEWNFASASNADPELQTMTLKRLDYVAKLIARTVAKIAGNSSQQEVGVNVKTTP